MVKNIENFGNLNPHHIGLSMKEMVRRAILEIRRQRFSFTSEVKDSYYKKGDDLVTSADNAAQEIYLKIIKENFPDAGIIAEENFACECADKSHTYYFTVDPLDGTKAYGRRQSHAIATMIAFVFDGEISGATIGDVMTEEIFHARPGSMKVYRISDFEKAEELTISNKSLGEQYIQLFEDPRKYSQVIQDLTSPSRKREMFKGLEVMKGSIGFMFARLWKGEIGALVIRPGKEAPWDMMPVWCISERLGFIILKIIENSCEVMSYTPFSEVKDFNHEVVVIHKNNLEEFESFLVEIK